MKNRNIIMSIAAIAVLTACSNDVEIIDNRDAVSNNNMEYKALSGKADTRVASQTTGTLDKFKSIAILTDGTNKSVYAIHDVHKNGGAWGYDNPPNNEPTQWPTQGTMTFIAYSSKASPVEDPANLSVGTAFDVATDVFKLTGYTVPTDLSTQEDLLVAYNKPESMVTAAKKKILLTFRHALSRVEVKAKTGVLNNTVKVTKVSLLNLVNTGDVTIGAAIDTTNATGATAIWDNLGTTLEDFTYTFPAGTPQTITNGSDGAYQDLLTGDKGIMVVPQATTIGANIPMTSNEDPATGFYLMVELDNGLKYYVPVKDPTSTAAQPVPFTFVWGKRYTFKLTINLNNIDFNVDVADWVESQNVTPDTDPSEGYVPAAPIAWAGSNIYWKADKSGGTTGQLVFADATDNSVVNYQGLYFLYGSLIGLAPDAAYTANSTIYVPDPVTGKYTKTTVDAAVQAGALTSNVWQSGIRTVKNLLNQPNRAYLYEWSIPENYANYLGDVCKFLSDKKQVSFAGKWRMPTCAEFATDNKSNYSAWKDNNPADDTNKSDGTAKKYDGLTYTNAAMGASPAVQFFCTGRFLGSSGGLNVQGAVSLMTSSSGGNPGNYQMVLTSSNVVSNVGTYASAVRCVKESN